MKILDIEAKKLVFTGEEAILESYRIEKLKDDEILVKTKYSLISIGTETTLYIKKRWNTDKTDVSTSKHQNSGWDFDNYGKGDKWDLDKNMKCPGYALAGDVIEVGEKVTDFKIGDRVISLQNHCNYAVCSTKPWHTLKIPDGVSYEESTFSVLASVALHGIRRSNIRLGEDIVIMGAGLVGLLLIQFAKKSGAYPIISVDLCQERLELAKKLGADFIINPDKNDLVEKVRKYIGQEGTNCTIEAVGNPRVLQNCLKISAPGARVVVMGAILGEISLDLYNEFVFRELNLIAAQQPRNPTEDTIYYHFTGQRNRLYSLDLLKRGELNVKDLITHRFKYIEASKVYALLGQAKNADYDAKGNVNRDMIGVLLEWEG